MFRAIKESDLPALTKICVAGMKFDTFNEELVREKTFRALDFDPELSIAYDKGSIRGFIQGAVGNRNGKAHSWIRLLVVDPEFRQQGIGSSLLKELEKRLNAKDAQCITTMDCPTNYLSPGIDSRYTEAYNFLEKNGYRRFGTNLNLLCDISAEKFDVTDEVRRLASEGLLIRRAETADQDAVTKFLRTHFPMWEDEVLECFKNSPISLYLCIRKNAVIGFSAYQGNNKSLPWFGPMGVVPETRGKGIGAVVCKLCLRDIALQGYKQSIIPWVGPVRFYAKVCDARIDRIFWVWEKQLQEPYR